MKPIHEKHQRRVREIKGMLKKYKTQDLFGKDALKSQQPHPVTLHHHTHSLQDKQSRILGIVDDLNSIILDSQQEMTQIYKHIHKSEERAKNRREKKTLATDYSMHQQNTPNKMVLKAARGATGLQIPKIPHNTNFVQLFVPKSDQFSSSSKLKEQPCDPPCSSAVKSSGKIPFSSRRSKNRSTFDLLAEQIQQMLKQNIRIVNNDLKRLNNGGETEEVAKPNQTPNVFLSDLVQKYFPRKPSSTCVQQPGESLRTKNHKRIRSKYHQERYKLSVEDMTQHLRPNPPKADDSCSEGNLRKYLQEVYQVADIKNENKREQRSSNTYRMATEDPVHSQINNTPSHSKKETPLPRCQALSLLHQSLEIRSKYWQRMNGKLYRVTS